MDIKLLEALKITIPLMPGFTYLKDNQGTYLACSPPMAKAAGLAAPSEIIGKTDFELPWQDLAADIRQSDLEILATDKPQSIEEHLPIADNKKIILLCNKKAIKAQDGTILGLIGFASDITLSKQQHEALQVSKDQTSLALENILDNIPAHIFWKDSHCILLGCNDQQAKNMGFASGKEMVGKSNYDVISTNQPEYARQAQADAITKVDLQVMATGIDHVVEEPLVLPDGNTAIYLSKKTPLRNQQGEIIGLLGIAFDITTLKKTEQELQEAQHKLEGMTVISASIAHELRTPLATIAVGAGSFGRYISPLIDAYKMALAANLPVQEFSLQLLEQLKTISQSLIAEANAGNIFIDMLLQNIRPKLDRNSTQTFTISACINEALERYPFVGEQKELIVWHTDQDFLVRGKEDKLIVHVLFNLLKNALFYIVDAGKGNIQIRLEPGKVFNKLIFKDTGKGIAADMLPHIFDRFFSRTRNGAGVGLTYCKMVLENLGGAITCESELGSYTQFILSFPAINENR